MAPSINFKALAAACLNNAASLVARWLPAGKRDGHEWKALNPTRSDSKVGSFSINLNTGAWADFATDDKGGDLVSLYAYIFTNNNQGNAAKELSEQLGVAISDDLEKKSKPEKVASLWHPVLPAPTVDNIPVAHPVRGRPEAVWHYKDADGNPLGFVYRFKTSDGGKEVLPLCWAKNSQTGKEEWHWMAFPQPRPLYGLERLAAKPDATVLVVEGEKCADAAAGELADLVVVTWPGGSKAVDKIDWRPLSGRKVMIWPDCDAQHGKDGAVLPEGKQPGMVAAEKIAGKLAAIDCKIWLVKIPPPGEKLSGWDVADAIAEGLRGSELANWIRGNLRPHAAAPEKKAPASKREDGLLWKKGELVACLANIVDIITRADAWRGVIGFDEFSNRTMKLKAPPFDGGAMGEWDSTDDSKTTIWLTKQFGMTPAAATVAESIELLARENTYHPVRRYLRGLVSWDGHIRDTWLSDFCGATDSPYTRLVGRFFLMAMVARVMNPGCKFDFCLVLEGEQGKGKSSIIAVLGGEWTGDTDLDLQSKDSMASLPGHWIWEFAELGALAKAESIRQKSFLSRQVDEFRPVYGRRNIRCPRQVVFAGTTNEWEWNKDPTGGRRFWPVSVLGDIDLEGLKQVRDQLFAEALHRYEAGERYWPSREEQKGLFDPEQLKAEQQESLVDALHDWVFEQVTAFSATTAAMVGLKLDASKLTPAFMTRIGIALRKLGCKKIEKRNGMTRFWYEPPQKSAWSTASIPQREPGEDENVPF